MIPPFGNDTIGELKLNDSFTRQWPCRWSRAKRPIDFHLAVVSITSRSALTFELQMSRDPCYILRPPPKRGATVLSLRRPPTMVRRHIPKEIKEHALRMVHDGVPYAKITEETGMKTRTISRLVLTYRQTGSVIRVPLVNGRPPTLGQSEIDVSAAFN